MHRTAFFLPNALLGLVLVLALAGFAVSASVDPIVFSKHPECSEPFDYRKCEAATNARLFGLPPITDAESAELRIWRDWFGWSLPKKSVTVVTPAGITKMGDDTFSWSGLLPWHSEKRKAAAADILALAPSLNAMDDWQGGAFCGFDSERVTVEGVYKGRQFFVQPTEECEGQPQNPEIIGRLFDLLETP